MKNWQKENLQGNEKKIVVAQQILPQAASGVEMINNTRERFQKKVNCDELEIKQTGVN